jgi:hypothetical protein
MQLSVSIFLVSERSVTTYPLEALDPTDPTAALKRGKHLSSHTSFFKSGMCLGRTLLCIVKSSSLSSTIKTLEPVDLSVRAKRQPTPFRRLLNNSNEPFKVFKVNLSCAYGGTEARPKTACSSGILYSNREQWPVLPQDKALCRHYARLRGSGP